MMATTLEAKQKLVNERSKGEYHADVYLWSAPYVGDLPVVQCDILIVHLPGRQIE